MGPNFEGGIKVEKRGRKGEGEGRSHTNVPGRPSE